MKVLIIEDEKLTADDLADTIRQADPSCEIVAILYSVKEGLVYFANNAAPDLIFSDIQLGDGLSFDIFGARPMSAPVIFCTAFDEYALKAFKANGIDYLLKPFTLTSVEAALNKYKTLTSAKLTPNSDYLHLIKEIIAERQQKPSSILVYYKDIILPVQIDDIALCFVKNEITHILTFNLKTFFPKSNLDELEKLTGNRFFRTNRQCLVNRKSVLNATSYLSRKLSVTISVPFDDIITVSREKTPQFLQWLSEK